MLHDHDFLPRPRPADDGQICRSDHKVLVNKGMIDSMTEKLLLRHAIASPDARRIRLTQGQMTGRILIKERIVKEDTAR